MITVTSLALPTLHELLDFLVSQRITRIHINLFRPVGRGKDLSQWQVSSIKVQALLREFWSRRPISGNQPGIDIQPEDRSAGCGIGSFLNILPNGDAYPCHVLMKPAFYLGNIRRKKLLEICQMENSVSRLRGIDCRRLIAQKPEMAELIENEGCRGILYHISRSGDAGRN